jgi:hypothetical protein
MDTPRLVALLVMDDAEKEVEVSSSRRFWRERFAAPSR